VGVPDFQGADSVTKLEMQFQNVLSPLGCTSCNRLEVWCVRGVGCW
jgi:hypothetical protein